MKHNDSALPSESHHGRVHDLNEDVFDLSVWDSHDGVIEPNTILGPATSNPLRALINHEMQ